MASITIVSGCPGTGKTTLSRALACAAPAGLHLVSDTFYQFPAHPLDPTTREAQAQNRTIIKALGRATAAFVEGGYDVFVDGVIGPWFLPTLCHEWGAVTGVEYVILQATLEVVNILKEETVIDFYDQLSPFYHLIYEDWEASMVWQAERLHHIIAAQWGKQVTSILDVSCGIGTQCLGLARQGFQITASDLSSQAIARARREAEARHLSLRFSVCDMRQAFHHHGGGFDVVISCDNSIPHLLSDTDILGALHAMYACLRPGGGCLLTIRAYDQETRGRGIVKPYGIRAEEGKRYLIFQVWDFEGEQYVLSMYFIEDDMLSGVARTQVMRSRYYAIHPEHLLSLMTQAGFQEVRRLDEVFYQPVLVGTKPM